MALLILGEGCYVSGDGQVCVTQLMHMSFYLPLSEDRPVLIVKEAVTEESRETNQKHTRPTILAKTSPTGKVSIKV